MTLPCPCGREVRVILDEYHGEWIGRCVCGKFVVKEVKEGEENERKA